jgi:predicted enzyme related to lactoylglutathione lyase
MPEFSKPVPGNFCWIEANLEDPARGKGFYGELFGWSFQDMPMPSGTYTMMTLGDKQIAGLMKLPEEAKKMGAPPHWLSYVAVDDAQRATDKAKELGGKVLAGPMSVGPGTMSVIQDPTGAVFALWASQQSMGTFLWREVGALCWSELATTDVEAAKKFYVGLFGWKTQAWPMGDFEYTVLKNGDLDVAGLMPQPKMMAGAPSMWTAYFAVSDCDATAAKATKLGATVLVPPTDIPNVGRFAVIADTQGATFAILKGATS